MLKRTRRGDSEQFEHSIVLYVLFIAVVYFGEKLLERRTAGGCGDIRDAGCLQQVGHCLDIGLQFVLTDVWSQALYDGWVEKWFVYVWCIFGFLRNTSSDVLHGFVYLLWHCVEVTDIMPNDGFATAESCQESSLKMVLRHMVGIG